jgi:hypothetical protein
MSAGPIVSVIVRSARRRVWIWWPDGSRSSVLTDDHRSWVRRCPQ